MRQAFPEGALAHDSWSFLPAAEDGLRSMIEMDICAKASEFIGTEHSRFTMAIQGERIFRGTLKCAQVDPHNFNFSKP